MGSSLMIFQLNAIEIPSSSEYVVQKDWLEHSLVQLTSILGSTIFKILLTTDFLEPIPSNDGLFSRLKDLDARFVNKPD